MTASVQPVVEPMKQRQIRVPDSLWERGKEIAASRNTDISTAMRDLLRQYVEHDVQVSAEYARGFDDGERAVLDKLRGLLEQIEGSVPT